MNDSGENRDKQRGRMRAGVRVGEKQTKPAPPGALERIARDGPDTGSFGVVSAEQSASGATPLVYLTDEDVISVVDALPPPVPDGDEAPVETPKLAEGRSSSDRAGQPRAEVPVARVALVQASGADATGQPK